MRHPSEAEQYIQQLFAQDSAAHQQASQRLKDKFPALFPIQLAAHEGKLLQLFMRLAGVKRAVEIGSLAGYSALWIAEALPEDGTLYAINKDPSHHALLLENIAESADAHKIQPHCADALDVLPQLSAQGPFDMVFIDADKLNYAKYLDWAEENIRSGGLVIGDNTLLFGHVWKDEPPVGAGTPSKSAWKAMREFNQRLANAAHYHSVLIPTEEGMTVAIRK
jgi:predicted O-methyltransferase YrrM